MCLIAKCEYSPLCVIVEVLLLIHTSLYLFYFSCRKEGDIPLGVVNIMAYFDPTYEEVNNYRPSLPLPSAPEIVGGVNLESCPANVSATEGVGGVNLKHEYEDTDFCRPPSPPTATEEVGGYLGICLANMSATEEVGATCGSLPGAD